MCRYMVVLRLGGVYADIDCECLQPFNQLIRPRDTMVVAWENEFSTAEEARRRAYVRKRQVSFLEVAPTFGSGVLSQAAAGSSARQGGQGHLPVVAC